MSPLHPRKVRRLLKHFKNIKEAKVENVKSLKPEPKKPRVEFHEPSQELISSIKASKDNFKIEPPKIIINTTENKELPFLKQKLMATEKELDTDERRLYDLFSDISGLKEEIDKQESEGNEQDQKIMELEREI